MADNKSSDGKLIGGKRYCGKTTELIKRASEEQLYILCANKTMARLIFKQAQNMELQIPFPVTVEDLPLKGYMNEVLVDEVETVLSQLVGKRVVGMSSSMEFEELESLNKSSEEKMMSVQYVCLNCQYPHREITYDKKEYKEELVCPSCGGKAVDKWKMSKYIDGDDLSTKPLLVIELQDESSVPKVFYKGKEVTLKTRVLFEWETETHEFGGTRYNIEHYVKGHRVPTKKGYGLARGKYVFDGDDD